MAFSKKLSPNRSWTLTPQGIMLHHTGGGTFESNMRWLCNPKAQASANFLIGKKLGQIVILVPLNERAWHAGIGGPLKLPSGFSIPRNLANAFTIGIELVNAGDGRDPYTKEQLANLDAVIDYIDKVVGKKLPIIDHKAWAPGRKSDLRANFPLTNYQKYRQHTKPDVKAAEPKPKTKAKAKPKYYTVKPSRGAVLRKSASVKAKKVASIAQGKTVRFISNARDVDDRLWRKVSYSGAIGYIRADLLKLKG